MPRKDNEIQRRTALVPALEAPLPADYFLEGIPALQPEADLVALLSVTHSTTGELRKKRGNTGSGAIIERIDVLYAPTGDEIRLLMRMISWISRYYRAVAADTNYLSHYQAQLAASKNKVYALRSPPTNSPRSSCIVVIPDEMDGAALADSIHRVLGISRKRTSFRGQPAAVYQIPALVVLWPSSGDIDGLWDRVAAALDKTLGIRLFSVGRRPGFRRKTPETMMQMLFQIFNVGLVYIHGIKTMCLSPVESPKCFAFLSQISIMTGIPVVCSGTLAMYRHVKLLGGVGRDLMRMPSIFVDGYSDDELSEVAKLYLDELAPNLQKMFSINLFEKIASLGERQRGLIRKAVRAAIQAWADTGIKDKDLLLQAAELALMEDESLLEVLRKVLEGTQLTQAEALDNLDCLPSTAHWFAER